MPFYTGAELKLLRTSRNLTQTAVAKAMGVGQDRISVIEARAVVPTKAAERYLKALRDAEVAA